MERISYSHARQHFKGVLDSICASHEPVVIHRKQGDSVVVLSEDDYLSLAETAYLMRSSVNFNRLVEASNRDTGKSIENVRKNLGV